MVTGISRNPKTKETATTMRLLAAGAAVGPLFIGASLIQALIREGFQPTRHAISLLLLGDFGWIQLVNFVVTGILAITLAVGTRRMLRASKGGTWGPLLIGAYGVLLIAAGLFAPDPAFSFPYGTPEGVASTMSGHAGLHSLAFFGLTSSVVAACFVFARRFRKLGQRSWANYCLVTGLGTPILLIAGIGLSVNGNGGLPLLGVAVTTASWFTAIAVRLRAEIRLGAARSGGPRFGAECVLCRHVSSPPRSKTPDTVTLRGTT